jgi:hypothetical protein
MSESTPLPSRDEAPSGKRTWETPKLTKLPPLTALTLQTGGGIHGGGAGGGTVF